MARKFCARDLCREPVSPPSRRFCAEHRQEHSQGLLAQLAALDPAAAPAGTAAEGDPPPTERVISLGDQTEERGT